MVVFGADESSKILGGSSGEGEEVDDGERVKPPNYSRFTALAYLPSTYHLMPPCAKGRFNFFADHFFQHPLINYKHPSARLVGNWTTKICDDQSLCFCDDCEDDMCRYFIDNVKKVWTRNSSDH